jgi:hypothetical protein
MRKSWVQLYAPFLVLAIVQALFIAVAPSRGGQGNSVAAFGSGTGSSPSASSSGGAGGGSTDFSSTGGSTADAGTGATGGTDGSTTGGSGGTGATGATGSGGGNGGTAAAAGDTSHCKDGLQFKLLANGNPPCVPKFEGDNGGATYQGVTADSIKIVWFDAKPNDQVNAILATQGLAVPYDESVAYRKLAIKFVEKHFETYGRKLDVQFVMGDCPTTPPDYDKCNAAAQEVVKMKPALVIWGTSLYASVFDIWAKAGIPSLGGWQFEQRFFNDRRPYRYDPFMDGTQVGAHIAEYYCKKMAKRKADHTGRIIHATIGQRGQVDRKLGIVTPEIEANVLAAKEVAAKVKDCGGVDVPVFTYESDIERASEQTAATVSGLIQAKVTTVACMCDPIAPAFLTNGMDGANYHPEFLLTGEQFQDADLVGRLYNPNQMAHAFGIRTINAQIPLDQQDAAIVWRDMGNQGHACGSNGCGIEWSYADLLGTAIQMAGPNFNPLSMEKGLLTMKPQGGWEASGHNHNVVLAKFGPNDYTSVSDTAEVYWDANKQSEVDGKNGAWVEVNGGRRYELGQWGGDLSAIPVRD